MRKLRILVSLKATTSTREHVENFIKELARIHLKVTAIEETSLHKRARLSPLEQMFQEKPKSLGIEVLLLSLRQCCVSASVSSQFYTHTFCGSQAFTNTVKSPWECLCF